MAPEKSFSENLYLELVPVERSQGNFNANFTEMPYFSELVRGKARDHQFWERLNPTDLLPERWKGAVGFVIESLGEIGHSGVMATERFQASRWTKGNFLFPTIIEVDDRSVLRRKRHWFTLDEITINLSRVASDHIKLRCGGSSITLTPDTIIIDSPNIKIQGGTLVDVIAVQAPD